ncbi:helix-turn-helix transcriptional regulator [Pusillimonas sp. SM2304]|uniref:helix-turn-helix transcriptional regulator n=1 Tax=Pusillimonas sp. SM2304 TaxID=3073241 RepID=UPI002876E2B8|nr:helix-turn-helix transcriptional regulator [Pusillimonas sp. SM2304]MDS1141559.1 helix-turn-helix transcriptional regulator [Pusillimonas sp. SM2304]
MSKTPSASRTGLRHLQSIVAGLSDGLMLIGTDQSIVWANEAALAMHGARTQAGLGKTVAGYSKKYSLKYRNNRLVRAGQYPAVRALAGEAFSGLVVQVSWSNGRFGRVHELRSLRLDDAAGKLEYAALVMSDVTDRFNAEARFEQAFNTNPAPALICRLSDFRYVRVNQGFLEMTGLNPKQVIGRSAYELDVLSHAEDKNLAIARIHEGRTIPQMEATLMLPGGKRHYVIVAGQPIDVLGESCLLFTFIDLEARKKMEDALRQTEERFSKAFRLAPVPMIVSTLDDARLLEVNEAFLKTTGYTNEDVLGKDAASLEVWASKTEYRAFENLLKTAGSVRNHGIQLCTKEGMLLDCLASADIVAIDGKRCILSVIQDMTEHKQSEDELIAAIDAVMQDASWFSRTVIEKLAQIRRPERAQGGGAQLAALTAREREVLGLMCKGLTDDEIGAALHLSRNTVRNHIAKVYNKIEVHRRSAAIVWGRERGILGREKRTKGRPS